MPEPAFAPMCIFILKCHWLPFLVWRISGSRCPLRFLVEDGAAMIVASTTVPSFSINPLAARWLLMLAKIRSVCLWVSSKWRN